MSDLISRQAAITLPVMPKEHREYQTFNLDDAYEQGWDDLQKCIEELPSEQHELSEILNEAHNEGYDVGYWAGRRDYEPRWIPVTERLPEKYGWYLCSGKDGRVMMRFWNNHRWWDNIRKSMFEMYDIYGKLTGKKVTDFQEQIDWTDWVTAWMPLPEPWKGEEDENNN